MRNLKNVSLIGIFSALLLLITLVNRYIFHMGQLFFAIVFTLAAMLIKYRGAATLLSSLTGLMYSITSALGPLIIIAWIVRGGVVDLCLVASKRPLTMLHPLLISIIMVLSSVATALTHYFFFVKFLRVIPELPLNVVSFMIAVAAILTFIGSYISSRFLYGRIAVLLGGK